MDYEKAYKDVLERARHYYLTGKGEPVDFIKMIFPELKESEDERIRKAIHIYLDWLDGRNKDYQPKGDYSIKDMITWLKKQGEKKSQRMISAEAKEAMYDKPAWSEEDELVIKDIEEAITNYWHGQSQEDLLDRLKTLKQRIGG